MLQPLVYWLFEQSCACKPQTKSPVKTRSTAEIIIVETWLRLVLDTNVLHLYSHDLTVLYNQGYNDLIYLGVDALFIILHNSMVLSKFSFWALLYLTGPILCKMWELSVVAPPLQ